MRRAATSPYKLVSSFAPPNDHVRTLHDNLENSIAKYPHVSTMQASRQLGVCVVWQLLLGLQASAAGVAAAGQLLPCHASCWPPSWHRT